jgi:restriction endonuclease Mrr
MCGLAQQVGQFVNPVLQAIKRLGGSARPAEVCRAVAKDALKEAVRDGVPPIELVDGEKLVELFESLELGLIPRTTYDVDPRFFVRFEQEI